jgi:hypothetical protein
MMNSKDLRETGASLDTGEECGDEDGVKCDVSEATQL